MKYRVFISAAEPSADAHCAGLITALKQTGCEIEFVGVGGPKMAAAGCELLEDTTGKAAMTYNAFGHIAYFYGLIKRISSFLKNNKTDLVIVCDSPAFNFHVAKAAKKLGVKTLFYVAPQLWAWAEWRIGKLHKYCDKLCCILPFEQAWFASRGIDVTFVGHPLLDETDADLSHYRKRYVDFEPRKAVIALMPGSRDAEINSLWVPMQQAAIRIKRKYPNVTFTAAAVDEKRKDILKSVRVIGFKGRYEVGSVAETARQADFAIVASGSATLQVAAAGCPMVIMYQSNKIIWHLLGRWLVKTKHLSLVNILAGKELVPEFMPYFSSIEPIADTVEKLLADRDALAQISSELIKLAGPLRRGNASEKTAQIVISLLNC
jgi:lipid-A-disaccharide synthase